MAVNDLMMKIQLIVESGKSSAELNRLQQALKALQTQLTALDRTQLAPLTRDLGAVKQAAAQLKTVNLGNFATQIDAVKKSFTGLGLATGTLDQLRTAYQKLNAQLTSGDLSRYQAQLKSVGDRLREAKALSLTSQGTTRNTTYERLNRDLGQYNSLILSATKSIVTQQQAILGLKNQLAALPKIKIDPTIGTTLKELVKNAQGKTLRVDDYQKSFSSMQGFNNELLNQQRLLDQSRLNAQKYQETLAKLRNEAQRAAIPDLTMGGTRNLIADLNQAQSAIRDLRSRGLLPLQNDLRNLQSTKSFQKSLNIAPLDAAVKRLKAELPDLKQKLDLATATGNVADVAKYSTRIASNKQEIIEKELKSAQLNEAMVNTLGKQIANTRNLTNETKNQLSVLSNEEKAIKSLIAAQKQSAQIASQTVKSRPGGIVDTAAAKAAAQAEANLYKNNIASLKQYLAARKAAATEDANLVKQQIQSAQQRLSQQQLTKAQWAAERAEIQSNISAEKARSQVYQQTLRDQQRSVKEAIQSEKEREQSLKTQIKTLTQLGTAQAQVKAIQLQSDLSSAKTRQGDLRTQVRDIEQAAKAEIQRIRTLDQSSQALRRQGGAVSSLGRLFREAGGPVKEFSAAIRFALGPQMAGFAAAGSIISLLSGFVAANKEIENLKRGLNAITGSSELYFQELSNTANRLGQSILVVSDSYLQLVAASKGTRLEGEATRQIFESVSNALVLTGADAVRSRRAFLALAQMMSKGQIYAEELRQQLSEALPGAVNIFSRALGVAPQKLLEMMKAGEVSSDALILFMEELKKTFPPVTQEMFTFSQKAAVLQNTMQRLFVEIGNTGIWNALGNGILSANKAISTVTDNVGSFGDEVKTTFGYLSTLGELTGIGELLGSGFEGLVDVSKSVVEEAISILEGLPEKAAEIAIRIRAAIQQAAVVTTKDGFFDNLLADAQQAGQKLEQLDRQLLAYVTSLVPDFGSIFDSLVSGNIEGRILRSEAALSKLQSTAQLTKEQFDALSRTQKQQLFQGIVPSDAEQGRAIAEKALATEKALIEELKKKRVLNQQITEERQADLSAKDEAAETRDYLNTFNEGYRTAIKSAKEAIAGAQRAAELSAKVGTVQDKQAANRIIGIKKIQDIENSLYETQVRSKEITDAAVKNRIDDERTLLELSLDRASAVAQSEANANNLRKGREDQGIYFTDDMKKASRDAQQARKLEQQALKLSERAAQSKNEVEKLGLLENSKYLQEQAAQLNQSAGETYRLKQNYEALEAIAQQLTKTAEAELKIRQDIAEAERLATQAEEARAKATDPQALKGERDEWSRIADERARAAAQKFSDAGLTEQATAMQRLRLELERIQQVGKSELENKIVAALQKFNLENQPDYQKVFADLGTQLNALRQQENDIVGQLQQTQSPESKAVLEERVAQIRRDFQVLNQAYLRVREQLQQAIDGGTAPAINFPSYLESTGAVNAVPQTLQETQTAVNQSSPIFIKTVLQAPTVTPEVAAPTTLSTAFKPVAVPVTFAPVNDSATQVIIDFQKALKGLPAQSLSAPVTIDTQNLLDPNRFGIEDLANAKLLRQEMEAIFALPIQQQVAVVAPPVAPSVQGLAEEDASLASSVLDIYRSVVTTIFGIIPAANAAEDSLQGVQEGFAQASTEASRFNQSLQDRPLVVTPEVPKNWLIDELNLSRQLLSGFKPLFEIQANANQVVTEGTQAGVAAAQAANQALAQNPVTLTAKTNLPQVTQELQTVGQQARTTVAELQKINQLPPGTYTIQAANPAEQQSLEERLKLLQQNPNYTIGVQWVTTGGQQTMDGFTQGIQKQAVVTVTAKANPAQAAAEGAKVGQTAATAANQAVAQNPLTIQAITLDSASINQGIQVAMDQAKATVKTSVAQMNQELVQKLGTQGVQVKIETVVDQTSFEGWQRQVQRLSAQDNRVPLRADTAELDQEFRRIDGQFAEWNRTAGAGLSAGFVTASQQAQNFGTLVDQVNQKMRAIQSPEKLPPFKPIVEPVVEVKDTYQQMQEQLNQQNPIQVSADAAPMIGEIQQALNELRASGATNIKVTLDEQTGQLIVTANTDPANEATQALIERIEASDAVLRVRVVYDDPGFSSSSSSASSDKKRWGGYISGYGGGDRIRALLEPGEFVLRKEAVKALGLSSLIKMNNLGFNAKIPKPSSRSVDTLPIPRFASGGLVSGQPIVINVPGGKSIQVQGSRDSAMALANLLTRVGRAV